MSIDELSKNRTIYFRFDCVGAAGSEPMEKVFSVCSLPSSQTLKSFSSRSVTYAPFLSVATASTRTSRVSVRIVGGCSCASATPQTNATPISAATQTLIASPPLRDIHHPVLRCHQLAFAVTHHQPDHVS